MPLRIELSNNSDNLGQIVLNQVKAIIFKDSYNKRPLIFIVSLSEDYNVNNKQPIINVLCLNDLESFLVEDNGYTIDDFMLNYLEENDYPIVKVYYNYEDFDLTFSDI